HGQIAGKVAMVARTRAFDHEFGRWKIGGQSVLLAQGIEGRQHQSMQRLFHGTVESSHGRSAMLAGKRSAREWAILWITLWASAWRFSDSFATRRFYRGFMSETPCKSIDKRHSLS